MSRNGSVEHQEAPASSPLDFLALRYEPLDQRPSKVSLAAQGCPLPGQAWFADWLDTLPRVLGADALGACAMRSFAPSPPAARSSRRWAVTSSRPAAVSISSIGSTAESCPGLP